MRTVSRCCRSFFKLLSASVVIPSSPCNWSSRMVSKNIFRSFSLSSLSSGSNLQTHEWVHKWIILATVKVFVSQVQQERVWRFLCLNKHLQNSLLYRPDSFGIFVSFEMSQAEEEWLFDIGRFCQQSLNTPKERNLTWFQSAETQAFRSTCDGKGRRLSKLMTETNRLPAVWLTSCPSLIDPELFFGRLVKKMDFLSIPPDGYEEPNVWRTSSGWHLRGALKGFVKGVNDRPACVFAPASLKLLYDLKDGLSSFNTHTNSRKSWPLWNWWKSASLHVRYW